MWSDDISYLIKHTKESLRHIPNKGIGYGILKYLTDYNKKKLIDFNLEPEISFNYLGQFNYSIKNDLFIALNENTGLSVSKESENSYKIMVIGMMVDGSLTITFNYNKLQYEVNTITSIADNYKENLIKIINHCIGKEEVELTPIDYGDDDLSFEELDSILNYVDKL